MSKIQQNAAYVSLLENRNNRSKKILIRKIWKIHKKMYIQRLNKFFIKFSVVGLRFQFQLPIPGGK